MKRIVCGLLILGSALRAQPYIDGGNTRHRFAQLTLGAEARYIPGHNTATFSVTPGGLQSQELNGSNEFRLLIGGLHFWGHADFSISLPIASRGDTRFFTGVETAARYFPWRIRSKTARPFIGIGWLAVNYQQGAGALLTSFRFPLSTGLNFCYKNHLFEVSAAYAIRQRIRYYITEKVSVPVKTPAFWCGLTYKFMIETTIGAEKNYLSGRTGRLTDTLTRHKKLNGITLSVGPSTGFFLRSSSHLSAVAPYAGQQRATIFPEFGAGYYFHRPDLQINLSYRKMSGLVSAFGYSQRAARRSLGLEAFKFLFDYHGFAWFTGLAASYEKLGVKEQLPSGEKYEFGFSGIKPGITFGWDIRPDRLQFFYLRTTLRYFPFLFVNTMNALRVNFDMLEFNFIQLVVFPGRI